MADKESGRFFDHFGLPRELRDQIYDEVLATEPATDLGKKNGLCYALDHVATLRLALLSHQFGEECEKRAQQIACLVLEDTPIWGGSEGATIQLPHAYSHVANLRFLCMNTGGEWAHRSDGQKSCLSCSNLQELDLHRGLILSTLAQYPSIRTVEVDLCLDAVTPSEERLEAVLDHQARLTTIKHLTRLEVHRLSEKRHPFDMHQLRRVVLRWSPMDGQLKRVEQADAEAR